MVDERRSVKIGAFFTVPYDIPEGRVPFDRYVQIFVDRKEKEGWRLERVYRVYRAPGALLEERKTARKLYYIDALFSRPRRQVTLEVPDRIVGQLLKNGRFRLLD